MTTNWGLDTAEPAPSWVWRSEGSCRCGQARLLWGSRGASSCLCQLLGTPGVPGLVASLPQPLPPPPHGLPSVCVWPHLPLQIQTHPEVPEVSTSTYAPGVGRWHDSVNDRWVRRSSKATATFPGLGPRRLGKRQTLPKGQPGAPSGDASRCPKALGVSHPRGLAAQLQNPWVFTHSCNEGKNPRSKNSGQLFTLAFLSCRRSWLGNHESNKILYGMSKNKRNKSRLTHLLSPPWGAADWECLPSQLLLARCPARTLAVCIPLDPLSRCLSHCL